MKNLIFLLSLLIHPFLTSSQYTPKFEYKAKTDKTNASLIIIEAKLINKSNKSIYFLSQSCNGLDYYLKPNDSNIKLSIFKHCNATFPRKKEIKPNSEYVFISKFRKEKNITNIGLTLNFVQLDSLKKVNEKSFREIRKEYINRTLLIKGEVVLIKK